MQKQAIILSLFLAPAVLIADGRDAIAEDPNCFGGCPVSVQETGGKLVARETHTFRNNPVSKFADWVGYQVREDKLDLPDGADKPKRKWRKDGALDADKTFSDKDYKGANAALKTDRGHQAPLASFYGYTSVQDVNLMSNITPQKSALNQGPWKQLEDDVRDLARDVGVVHVMTGTLYEREMQPLPNASEPHEVPSGYWKVLLVDTTAGTPGGEEIAAFIMDQDLPRDAEYCATAVTIQTIEIRAGLDLFPDLEFNALETTPGGLFSQLGCPLEIAHATAINAHGAVLALTGFADR